MAHYIIDFMVVIDGKTTFNGLIGSASSMPGDYQPNLVKRTIENQYRIRYPNAKSVAVKIIKATLVSSSDYVQASKNFIELL